MNAMPVHSLHSACAALSACATTRRTRLGLTLMLAGILTLGGCSSQPQSKTTRATGPVDTVVVKKSKRQLELLSRGQVVRQYRVALGSAPVGHKYREGDQRTPEGRYSLNWRNPKSNFYKSLHISYPSEQDRAVSRQLGYNDPGGMIMIHGLPNYIQSPNLRQQYANRDWTEGCIAVQNHEMDEIWSLVKDGTPIHIMP
ncbi:L,D-transpeptidase catalytic domain [Allochromatium warmingii]|uniref:L,D-transpeptidase catalytic domain n=2 Tax=Allochromatium warmingii TaxID=61595 RepID=A0A1H3G7E0_ALLWA|nr:L,D-transpeptidase catalytic domain [Allochromatium warmingii]